jgi:hypothetical protein
VISTSYIGVLEKNIIKYVLELHYATKEEEERQGVNFVLSKKRKLPSYSSQIPHFLAI